MTKSSQKVLQKSHHNYADDRMTHDQIMRICKQQLHFKIRIVSPAMKFHYSWHQLLLNKDSASIRPYPLKLI